MLHCYWFYFRSSWFGHLTFQCSMVVTELPLDDAKRALEALCIPVISPLQVSVSVLRFIILILLMIVFSYILFLQEAINQGPEILSKRPSRQLTVHIDRFAYIFRCVQWFVLLFLHTPALVLLKIKILFTIILNIQLYLFLDM